MDRYLIGTIRVPRGEGWAEKANEKLEALGLHARHVIAVIEKLRDMEIVYSYLQEINQNDQ